MPRDPEALLAWLPTIALFGGLGETTLRRVVSMLGERVVEPGQDVCHQGDAGRAMYLIRSGQVLVLRDRAGAQPMEVVRLGPGEFFGEMTLIDVQTRSATVLVEERAELLSLGNMDLYHLYQEDVPGYVMILQNLCRELSRRLRATNERLQELVEARGAGGTLPPPRPSS